MARELLTSIEQSLLTAFVKTLTQTESPFCCGGTTELPHDQKLSLLYKLGVDTHAQSFNFPVTETEPIETLLKACSPAPHGRGTETVYDDSYRLARELHHDNFALTTDLVNKSGILESIAALTSSRDSSSKIVADLHKLNSYSVGGFFKSHRDTPKSDTHIGSLVIALPVAFEGGILRVSHEGKEVLFDWGSATSLCVPSGIITLPWAFLFSDVEHEVLPVTSGTRLTLTYEIFAFPTEASSAAPVVDGTTLPLYSDLLGLLKNEEFLPKGGKLGLALSHAYPINTAQDSAAFASHFKGRDAILHRVISDLEIPVELRAVYKPDDAKYWEGGRWGINYFMRRNDIGPLPSDGFGPVLMEPEPASSQLIFTSKDFRVVNDSHRFTEWEYESEFIKTVMSASFEPEIIWGHKPTRDTFAHSSNYLEYGNEASLGSVYAAAALVLYIPPVGQGKRAYI